MLPYAELDQGATSGLAFAIGVAEADLRPVVLDFAVEPNFVVFGDAECGKSSFLRALATSIVNRFTPDQARVMLVDYRRSLMGTIETPHLIGYGTAAPHTAELIDSAAGYLQGRLPGPEVTPAELRSRSWWTGPELFVLVDDYDLVAGGPTNPLRALEEHLPHARDVGLHLVLARRAAGSGRTSFEPVIQRLRELSTPGLVMSAGRRRARSSGRCGRDRCHRAGAGWSPGVRGSGWCNWPTCWRGEWCHRVPPGRRTDPVISEQHGLVAMNGWGM